MGVLKKCPTLPRTTCGGWQERMVAITPQNLYVQVTFNKEDRLSIGCPVPKIAFEERPHGRQPGRSYSGFSLNSV